MFSWLKQQSLEVPTLRTILDRLQGDLSKESNRTLDTLSRLCAIPETVEDICPAFTVMAKIRAGLDSARAETDLQRAATLLKELDDTATAALCGRPASDSYSRQTLARTIGRIAQARTEILELSRPSPAPHPVSMANAIVVPADLLYLAHGCLFPAERMVVVAGQRGKMPRLGALFDVTGPAHASHVKADPLRLARAMIAMEKSGSYLAAWGHSHPGGGADATHPSPIDTNQHAAWIRDYSKNLVSFIMVADGFVRFWGTAVESGNIQIAVTGNGITKEQPNVYRLDV